MKQIANKHNSGIENNGIEHEATAGNRMSLQESVALPNPTLLARVEAAIKEQPEFGVLRTKLLEHGGAEVVPPCGWNNDLGQLVIVQDPDLPALLDHGNLMTDSVVCRSRGMEPNRCHENIALLWLQERKRDALIGIGTGYCLVGDLWIQHSWGIGIDSLLETVGEREKYFGIRMEGVDADVFAFKALGREQRNWTLFNPGFVIRVFAELRRRTAFEPDPSVLALAGR